MVDGQQYTLVAFRSFQRKLSDSKTKKEREPTAPKDILKVKEILFRLKKKFIVEFLSLISEITTYVLARDC